MGLCRPHAPGTPESRTVHTLRRRRRAQIQVALIGAGGMGTVDANTAQAIDGIQLVGAYDLYHGRLDSAQDKWGTDQENRSRYPFLAKDYREKPTRLHPRRILPGIEETPFH